MIWKLAGHMSTNLFLFVTGGVAFLTAVFLEIPYTVDLNERCEHNVAGQSPHLELLLYMWFTACSTLFFCLSKLKSTTQRDSHKLLLLIACDLGSLQRKSNKHEHRTKEFKRMGC